MNAPDGFRVWRRVLAPLLAMVAAAVIVGFGLAVILAAVFGYLP